MDKTLYFVGNLSIIHNIFHKGDIMTEDFPLKRDERIDDLQIGGLKIIQNTKKFCFGMDAVLLANFAALDIVERDERILDLGTGTGIIPLLVWGKTLSKEIVGLEIQEDMVRMAKRSVHLNQLQDRIKIVEGDIISPPSEILPNYYDVIITNPPYMEDKGGLINPTAAKAISRHEILCSLEDIIKTTKKYLRSRGKFFMIHRSHRLVDILSLLRCYNIEPKKIRFVHPAYGKAPNLILIQAIKGGKPHLKIEKPLYVYKEEGDYTQEIYDIYQWNKDDN